MKLSTLKITFAVILNFLLQLYTILSYEVFASEYSAVRSIVYFIIYGTRPLFIRLSHIVFQLIFVVSSRSRAQRRRIIK